MSGRGSQEMPPFRDIGTPSTVKDSETELEPSVAQPATLTESL